MISQKSSQETPQESEQRGLHHRAKLAVRDPAIASQVLLKWHEKYAEWDPLIASRELAKQQEKYTIQDPGSASQELAKWQETYATRDPETAKHKNGKEETKETVKLLARGGKTEKTDRQNLTLVIKNSQTSTMWLL
jgi:hypothetical protein